MDKECVKEIILNAVEITKPSWSTWGEHWVDMDNVFLSRAYDQQGFDNWIFVKFLEKNNILSIYNIGKILDNSNFQKVYSRQFAGNLNKPFYKDMKQGNYGIEGENFYNSILEFNGRKGRFFWMNLWRMLVCCNYLKNHHKGSFAEYLKTKFAKYKKGNKISDEVFIQISSEDWNNFLKTNPWDELYGVGVNVFDYVMGDIEELEFVKNSYKLDSANRRFLTITGIFKSKPKELEHQEVVNYLINLDIEQFNLREINKGMYAYCSKLGCDKYCFCRVPEKCIDCKVNDKCEKNFHLQK